MATEVMEPKNWTAAEIPGLVRKKKGARQQTGTEPPSQPQVKLDDAPKTPLVTAVKESVKESLNGAVAVAEAAAMSPAEAHEELMNCLVTAQALVQKLREAADTYYLMCDYIEQPDEFTAHMIPVLGNVLRAVSTKDPNFVAELVEAQAKEIVNNWSSLQETADCAVDVCRLLMQQSKTHVIDQELAKLDR